MQNNHIDRRRKYSIRSIHSALFALLQEKELDDITITELCKAADVNRGTFYKCYRDIYDLYEHMENEFIDRLRELLAESDEKNFNSKELFGKVTSLLVSSKDFVLPKRGGASSQFMGKLMTLILPGIADNVLSFQPRLSQIEARFLGEYIIGGCARVYEAWITDGMKLPPEQIQKYIVSFVDRSLQQR